MAQLAMAVRRRTAFTLCREHGIALSEMAIVLGISEESFLLGLQRSNLSADEFQRSSGDLRLIRSIMELMRCELERLATSANGPWSKARLDALAQMARTMDLLSDMQERFAAARPQAHGGLTTDELRAALTRIDERINELANIRARELVREKSEPTGAPCSQPGMDGAGANDAAATVENSLEDVADTRREGLGQDPHGR